MPSPSGALATKRPDLAGSFMEFGLELNRLGFIGQQVFPVFETQKDGGKFGLIPIEQILKGGETKRAPGAKYPRGDWTFAPASFQTEEHGWEEPVDDAESRMYAEYFDAEQISAMRARDVVLRNYEKRVSAAVIDTARWTGAALTTAAAAAWATAASATPLTDVKNAKQKIYDGSGLIANAIIMSYKTWLDLREVAQVVDRVKSSGLYDPTTKGLNLAAMQSAFDLPYVLVGGGVFLSSAEGQAAVVGSVWDKTKVMVCRVATSNDFREACIGRTFHWSEDGSSIGATVESYRDETVRGDVIRARMQTDEVVLLTEAGHLITGA